MNKNKKLLAILICFVSVILFCSCGGVKRIDALYAGVRGSLILDIGSIRGGSSPDTTLFYRKENVDDLKNLLIESNPENKYEIYEDSIVIFTKENGAFIIAPVEGDKNYNYIFECIFYPYYLFEGDKMNIADINGKSFTLKYDIENVISFYQRAGFEVNITNETDTTKEINICDTLDYTNPVGAKYIPPVEKYTILYDNSSETVTFKFDTGIV
ncbi:MAG: hypothetical protein IJ033_02120 [Clostridia bacterium]|nr:hypothetical protein [Clostridia bacterium]